MTTEPKKTEVASGFIRAALAMPYLAAASQKGADTVSVLNEFGLDEIALQDPSRLVHAEVFYGCLNALAKSADTLYLGFSAGEQIAFDEWPPFRDAVDRARSLGEALNLMISQIPREANSVRYQLIAEGEEAAFVVTRLVEAKNSPEQSEGFGAAFFVRLLRSASGGLWQPSQVVVRTRYPNFMPKLVFGATVAKKRSGALELRFPAAWLFETTDFKGKSFLSRRRQIPPPPATEVSLINAFRAAAHPLLTRPELKSEDVAIAMGLDPARLVAMLKGHGTTPAREMRRLRVDEAKRALAGNQSISQISQSLGYTDPAHFSRFFRSQTGQSPRDFRKSRMEPQ